jgi:putative transposase
MGKAPGMGKGPKGPKHPRVQRARIFITDDLPGLEEAVKKVFPKSDWHLRVLHAVWDALNKPRKKYRKTLAKALKKYWAENQEEEKTCGAHKSAMPELTTNIHYI